MLGVIGPKPTVPGIETQAVIQWQDLTAVSHGHDATGNASHAHNQPKDLVPQQSIQRQIQPVNIVLAWLVMNPGA
jgi:hypothetical protein